MAARDPNTGRFTSGPSTGGVKVEGEWFMDDVLMKLEKVDKAAIDRIALATEAQAKVNIEKPFEHADGAMRGQWDTGDMCAATRAILNPSHLPVGVRAAVEAGMEYGVYQEDIRPFLMPAAEEVAKDAESIIESAARAGGLL